MFMQYSIGAATGRTAVRMSHGNQEKAARRKASREDSTQQTSLSTIAAFAMSATGAARATYGLLCFTKLEGRQSDEEHDGMRSTTVGQFGHPEGHTGKLLHYS